MPRQTHGQVARSPYSHVDIRTIDVLVTKAIRGVLALLTGAGAKADELGPGQRHPVPAHSRRTGRSRSLGIEEQELALPDALARLGVGVRRRVVEGGV